MPSVANVRQIGVFISEPGVKPVLADYDPTTIALEWSVVAGSRMWQATLLSNLALQERHLRDMTLQAEATRQVELWEIDPTKELDDPDFRVKPLFWGEIVNQQVQLVESLEREVLTARMEPYHLGPPIKGQRVRGVDNEQAVVNIPIEFNPMVDGKIIFNRWKPTDHTDWWYYWIDPESTRSESALAYHDNGGSAVNEEWDLQTICETLCLIANEDETFVKNIAHGNFEAMFPDPQKIRNVVLKTGAHLPEYLDAICQRHGFNWTIDQEVDTDATPEMKPKLRFFKQQSGAEKTVKMQAPAAVLDLDETNVSEFGMTADVGTLSNVIHGYGALIEREVTVPLFRAWSNYDDLEYNHEDIDNPVGRKWVANEAADYVNLRPEMEEPTLFGTEWQVKRRVVEDCLVYRDGQRRPPLLEYRDRPEGEILPVPTEWGWRVLPTEIGVYFTGQREPDSTTGGIPDEVLTEDVELFLTGTIRGDTRIEHRTDVSEFSPNSNEVETVIDLSDRFFDRAQMVGPYASRLYGTAGDYADDTDALIAHVAKVQEDSAMADIGASITLFGLHFDDEYKVGDIITKLEGREISFNRSISEEDAKYVQIVGITYHNQVGRQLTTLMVSPHGVAQ